MANYAILKSAIQDVIKQNGNNEITGEILQQSLLAMVNSLGAGYQFAGIAKLTPTQTDPGMPDQNVFYIAAEPGTYTNFPISGGYLQVAENEVAIFKYNGQWSKETTGAATAAQVNQLVQEITDLVFDEIPQTLTTISQVSFDSENPEISSHQNRDIRYVQVSAGEMYKVSVKRHDADGAGMILVGTTTTRPAIGVTVSNIEGGTYNEYETIVNISSDGFLLFCAYYNIEYGTIERLSIKGMDELSNDVSSLEGRVSELKSETDLIEKTAFDFDEKTPSRLQGATFDSEDPEIRSFSYGDIRYIPVSAGSSYRISLKRTDEQGVGKIYIGFTSQVPAIGVEVSNVMGGQLLQLDKDIYIENDGYLLYYIATTPEYEHIYQWTIKGASDDSQIPHYWTNTLNAKIGEINDNAAVAGVNGDSFVFITDIHYPLNNLVAPRLIEEILHKTSVRKIFMGGDFVKVEDSETNPVAFGYIRQVRNDYDFTDKVFAARGNHEIMNDLTAGQFYSVFNSEIEDIVNTNKKNYWYFDNKPQKIRYIMIDAPEERQSGATMGQEQAAWLENAISSLESGWSVIAFMHAYWEYGSTTPESISASAISHINAGLFAATGVTMIAVVVGHTHEDRAQQDSTYKYWIISTTCDSTMSGNRQAGTTNEQVFDVYNINTEQKKIMITRIGYGNDREYTYGV